MSGSNEIEILLVGDNPSMGQRLTAELYDQQGRMLNGDTVLLAGRTRVRPA